MENRDKFFFSPAFYASLTSLLLLTRPWKFVNPPKPVLELLLTARSPLHPLPGAVWVSLLPPVAGRSHQCVGALGPPAAPWGQVGDTDGGRATKQRWVFGEQGAARSRSCSAGIRTATLGKAKETLNLRAGSVGTLALAWRASSSARPRPGLTSRQRGEPGGSAELNPA